MNRSIEIDPADMLLYATVVRSQSFTRAAATLGLAKQTVSERVARLERALGVRLLERTTRRMRPTEAGRAYAEQCDAIQQQIAEANAAVQHRQVQPSGRLRVAVPALYGRRFLMPVVAAYLARYPRMRVDVVLTDRRVDLVADDFDVAIQIGRLPDSTARVRRIGDGYVYYVASPSLVAELGSVAPAGLADARCIGVAASEHWRVGDTAVRVTPVVQVNDLESQCTLAIAGVGVARLPGIVCGDAVRDGRLVRLFPEAPLGVRPVSVVTPSRAHAPPKVTRFVELLVKTVRPMTPI